MSMAFMRHALVGALLCASALAHAAGFPERPIRLVVPFAPGGAVSSLALVLANKMSTFLGQPVVAESRPGAAGTIAANSVAKAPKDGYILLLGTSATQGSAKYMNKDLPYDPIEDFAPVGYIGNVTVGIFASEKSAFLTLDEVMAAARARPGQLNFGTPGVGGASHLAAELFKLRAKLNLMHVPYAGNVAQMTDLVGGQTQLGFTGVAAGLPYAKDGRIRLVAVAARDRLKSYPNVPALGEVIPGYDAPAWFGVVAPRGTPAEALERLEKAVQAALTDREMQALMEGQGIDGDAMTAKQFGEKMKREMPLWEEAVRAAGVSAR